MSDSALAIITSEVCQQFGLSLRVITMPGRCQESICTPRQIVFYLARELTGCSLSQIGAMFNKNGATVVHGVKRIRGLMDVDQVFAVRIRDIRYACEKGLK